jgi:hypothetical protein
MTTQRSRWRRPRAHNSRSSNTHARPSSPPRRSRRARPLRTSRRARRRPGRPRADTTLSACMAARTVADRPPPRPRRRRRRPPPRPPRPLQCRLPPRRRRRRHPSPLLPTSRGIRVQTRAHSIARRRGVTGTTSRPPQATARRSPTSRARTATATPAARALATPADIITATNLAAHAAANPPAGPTSPARRRMASPRTTPADTAGTATIPGTRARARRAPRCQALRRSHPTRPHRPGCSPEGTAMATVARPTRRPATERHPAHPAMIVPLPVTRWVTCGGLPL